MYSVTDQYAKDLSKNEIFSFLVRMCVGKVVGRLSAFSHYTYFEQARA